MNPEQPEAEGPRPETPETAGRPIGRRVLLGTLGLGALGVVAAPTLQRG
ncbi:MAG: oxidoreductase, partial [Streptomyces sp.]|nr:oxidoreductase [Streptomyces sp.]